MKSSVRIIDAKTGEELYSLKRTAESENVKLRFSHSNQIIIPNSRIETEDQRLEVWVPEEGEEFEVTVYDVMEGLEQELIPFPTVYSRWDISDHCTGIDGADAVIMDDTYGIVHSNAYVVNSGQNIKIPGTSESYSKAAFKYVISGVKGFLTIPVVGNTILVQQTSGDRDIHVRLIDEGDEL